MKKFKVPKEASTFGPLGIVSMTHMEIFAEHVFVVENDHYVGVPNICFSALNVLEQIENAASLFEVYHTFVSSSPNYSFFSFLSSDSMAAKRSSIAAKQSRTTSENIFHESSMSLSMNLGGIVQMQVDLKMQVTGGYTKEVHDIHLHSFHQMTQQIVHHASSLQISGAEDFPNPHLIEQSWQERRQEVERMLRNGEVLEAIEHIGRYLELINLKNSVFIEFTVLSGRFNHNEKRHSLGQLGESEYSQERINIMYSLCNWMDSLESALSRE